MLEGMSILDSLDLDNVPDLEIVPAGEYELKLITAYEEESKKNPGTYNVVAIMEILGHPNAENVFRYLSLPNEQDEERTRLFKLRFLKEFVNAFGISTSDIVRSTDGDMSCPAAGATAWALLGVSTYEEKERNEVKKFK